MASTEKKSDLYFGRQAYRLPQLELYLSAGKVTRLFEGEQLNTSDKDAFIYYIKSGELKIYLQTDEGELLLAYCDRGGLVQTNSFLQETHVWDPSSVVATENSELVQFSYQQFYELLIQDRVLYDQYINNASTYSTLLKQRLLISSKSNAVQRLLTWVKKVCLCQEPDQEGVYTIQCNMSQLQVADLLFIHVTTCNKIFKKLYKQHIARLNRGTLTVWSLEAIDKYLEECWQLI